jgi:D-arabinose 1-dehydrogenase-like Zn-dependent alcohol dehydrogenase
MKKHIWLTGQGNATRVQIADALAIAAQPLFRVMTELLPLEDINIALDRLKASDVTGRIVLSIGTAESAKSLP